MNEKPAVNRDLSLVLVPGEAESRKTIWSDVNIPDADFDDVLWGVFYHPT